MKDETIRLLIEKSRKFSKPTGMSPPELLEAITKACKWSVVPAILEDSWIGAALSTLDDGEKCYYCRCLREVVDPPFGSKGDFDLLNATPRQKAEAFVRVVKQTRSSTE